MAVTLGTKHYIGPRKVEVAADGTFRETVSLYAYGADYGDTAVTADAATGALLIAGPQTDDAAFTPATSKVFMLGAFADDTGPDSVNEGDGGAVRMSLNRNLYSQIRDAAGNERGLNISAAGAAGVAGDTAHDAADAGSPVKVGVKSTTALATALPTAVATGDRSDVLGDEYGRVHVIAGGITDVIGATVTRPADTTAYAANDVIGTASTHVLTFTGCARVNGGTGVINAITITSSVLAGTAADLELWLFDTAPAAIADNAANSTSDAELLTMLPGGVIDVDNTRYVSTINCAYRVLAQNPIPFKCASNSKDLYGILVVRNAYTPSSNEVFGVRLGVSRD